MRLQQSLAGSWSFQLDPESQVQHEALQPDRTIPVPMPWQAVFPELARYSGFAWYQRTFTLDEPWLEGEVLLDFGAVDYWCQVYINGQCIGEHEGGYTPFRFPIRQYVRAGDNDLSVYVYDSVQSEITIPRWRDDAAPDRTQPPFDPTLIPHGKQTWYIDASGIWQDVTLSAVPARHIDAVHITPDIHTGAAHVRVSLNGTGNAGTLRVTLDGHTVDAPADGQYVELTIRVDDPRLWTPDTPALYTADISLHVDTAVDQVSTRFGFREISTADGKLLLNGEPIYLLCALDQDLYPETIYTVPSDDFLRDQFIKAKQLGLNSLRCHIKPPDPRYLDIADELGLLIWAEIPSWRTFHQKTTTHPSALYLDDAVKARVSATLRDMINRDYNHPSLVIWTIVNEDWGTALLLSESDRAWVADMVDECRRLDPTRLVVDNSPCPAPWGLSVHVKSDIDDFHVYANIPDQAEQFEQFAEQFALRPVWSFSNTGDAQRTGSEPIILSEFGNWGMPSLQPYGGQEPDWFTLSGWWSPWDGEPSCPTGVLERFDQLGLNRIWGSYETFAEATQWHAFQALKFEIETMRRLPALQGYVITELSDIYWESNGLLDFARRTKAFHDRFHTINAPDVIVPHLNRYAYWDDETARVRLYASHYSDENWTNVGARALADTTEVFSAALSNVARGEVRELGTAYWHMSEADTPSTATLQLHLEGDHLLAQNDVSVFVLPSSLRRATYTAPVAIVTRRDKNGVVSDLAPTTATPTSEPSAESDDWQAQEDGTPGSFERAVSALGYDIRRSLTPDTRLIVTDHPTADMLAWVRGGGDMLFLSNTSGSPFFWRQGRGGAYSGNWITSFSWLRTDIHRRLQVSSPLTLPFMDVIPIGVILGLPVTDAAVQNDFLAGQIAGWLRHPALHTVQFRYGRGRVIMTTYRIRETIAYQPVAAAMLHDLIEYLTSDACQPVLTANY